MQRIISTTPQLGLSEPSNGVELRQFLRPLLKWWWALLLVPALCGGIAFYLMQQSPRYYQAQTVLEFGQPLTQTENQLPLPPIPILGPTYKELVVSDQFLQLVVAQLGPNNTPSVAQLQKDVIAYHTYWTNTIQIQITANDPIQTLNILNTINSILINQTPQLTELQKKFITQHQAELTAQNTEDQKQIDSLNNQLDQANNTLTQDSINNITNSIEQLKSQIDDNNAELQGLAFYINQIQTYQLHAEIAPTLINSTLGPKPLDAALALGSLSLALLLVIIFLLEKTNDKLQSVEQLEKITGQRATIIRDTAQEVSQQDWELFASEIFATYNVTQQSAILLVLHDQMEPKHQQPPVVEALVKALLRVGVSSHISTFQNLASANPIRTLTKPRYQSEVLTPDSLPPFECQLIVQSLPVTKEALHYFSLYCDGVIVLAELNYSTKKNLIQLAGFLKNQPVNIKSVVQV